MVDQELLTAIGQMMDARLTGIMEAQKQELTGMMEVQRQELTGMMNAINDRLNWISVWIPCRRIWPSSKRT